VNIRRRLVLDPKMRSPREVPTLNRFSTDQIMRVAKGSLMRSPTDDSNAFQEAPRTLEPELQRLQRSIRILMLEMAALLILTAACCAKVWLS
jgi:hypothetical protein